MNDLLVIKLGGSAGIDTESFLDSLARVDRPYILVHGANAELDALMLRLGIEPRLVTSSTGQVSRYTDEETMDLFLMMYAGKVNKRLVEGLQRRGINAVGLTALDGGIARGRRKPRIRVVENGKPKVLEGDYAGSIERIDIRLVRLLLENGYVPVLTPPAMSHDGVALNVDGDKLAMELAIALQEDASGSALGRVTLLIFSNTAGLLADLNDPRSTVPTIQLDNLDEGLALAQGRMKKKVLAAAAAIQRGVDEVILADANAPDAVEAALAGAGTHVVGSAAMEPTIN